MAVRSLQDSEIMELLAAGPKRITTLCNAVDETLLQTAPAPNEWSANEVLAHLRACADVWGDAIERILAEDHPTIRALNPRTWISQTNYLQLTFHTSLNAFSLQRADLVERLQRISPEEWLRSAQVTGAGKALERSVHFYAQWLATHERPHIKQIERTLAALR